MPTTPVETDTAPSAPVRELTRGQVAALVLATIPMIAAGGLGAWGTYSNVQTVFPDSGTAAGVVAAGEGATFVLALVYVLLTLLGQSAPAPVRLGLWLLPVTASATGAKLATTSTQAVVYAVTPMAMCVAAEGIGLVARRVVVYRTGVDMEAQRRNAELVRRIAYHAARSERHPWERVRKWSALKAWRLMSRAGAGDAQLGSELIDVQRTRLTGGADAALGTMLTGDPATTALPVSLAAEPLRPALEPAEPTAEPMAEPGEPTPEPVPEPVVDTEPDTPDPAPAKPAPISLTKPAMARDQAFEPEPVLSPAEPTPTHTPAEPTAKPHPEPDETTEPAPAPSREEEQISTLAQRLKIGEQLTKNTAAQLLGVSPATAGRRLKAARERIGDGTGLYL